LTVLLSLLAQPRKARKQSANSSLLPTWFSSWCLALKAHSLTQTPEVTETRLATLQTPLCHANNERRLLKLFFVCLNSAKVSLERLTPKATLLQAVPPRLQQAAATLMRLLNCTGASNGNPSAVV